MTENVLIENRIHQKRKEKEPLGGAHSFRKCLRSNNSIIVRRFLFHAGRPSTAFSIIYVYSPRHDFFKCTRQMQIINNKQPLEMVNHYQQTCITEDDRRKVARAGRRRKAREETRGQILKTCLGS